VVNTKCDQVPDDSDVREPCDRLLDEADVVEADATGFKDAIVELYSEHVDAAIGHLRTHFNRLATHHHLMKTQVETIRQQMIDILNQVKARHESILANPFPDKDYDATFTWALS
jgi:hypothetical protein